MNLKEAFRFQNKLQSMMADAQSILGNNGNITKVQNTYLRHKVMAEAEDETILDLPQTEYAQQITDIARFMLYLLEEKGRLFAAIRKAKDAQEFNEIVLGILNDHHVKKMVKSKSMLTEECEMNPYLEKHGIDVVETDLGERIIQLLGQKPSHIVKPAIHLKREEVGKMFEEKGISKEIGNYDPTYQTHCGPRSLCRK